jgi:hypothetical protein
LKLDQKRVALGVCGFRLLNYYTRWVVRMLEMKFPFDLEPSRNDVCLKVGVVCCETPLDHDKAERVGLAMLLFGSAAMKDRRCRWWLVRQLRSF